MTRVAAAVLLRKLASWGRRAKLAYRLRYLLIVRGPRDLREAPPEQAPLVAPDIPALQRLVAAGTAADPVERALQLALALSLGHERGPGVGLDLRRTLDRIERGGAGVCSDYSQVFLAACLAAGIPCREWGATDDFLNPTVGHTFCEVADAGGAWKLIDPFVSVAVEGPEGQLLSVHEIRDAVAGGTQIALRVRGLDTSQPRIRGFQEGFLERYFERARLQFVLVNNNPYAQDRFLRFGHRLPTPIVHGMMIAAGCYPRFTLQAGRGAEAAVARLRSWGLRWGAVWLAGLFGVLTLWLSA